jgi:hypothetical protein
MTGRTVIDSADEPAGDRLVRAVAAARRRLRFVTTLRLVAIAGPSGVAAGAAVALAGWAPAWAPVATGLLGAVAATAWGSARTPPPATVARILDAHLELKDRVAAALQLRESSGPIAALVARDAMARLAGIKLQTLFPVTIDRAPAIATAAAVAMSAWLVSSSTGPARSTVPGPRAGSSLPSDTNNRPGRGNARASKADSSEQGASQRGPTSAGEPRRADTGDQPPREAGLASDAGTAVRTPIPASDTPGGAPTPAPRNVDAGSTTSPAATPTRSGGAGPAGQTPSGAITAGAGGAAPGSAPVDIAGDALGAGATQRSAASYRAARVGAEAALARDVIPPDYREHVRAYFGVSAGAASPGGPR